MAPQQAPMAPPKDATPRWAAITPAAAEGNAAQKDTAPAPLSKAVQLRKADMAPTRPMESDTLAEGQAAEVRHSKAPPSQSAEAPAQTAAPAPSHTHWEGVEALEKAARRQAKYDAPAAAEPGARVSSAGITPPETIAAPAATPPPAGKSSSVDIDAPLAGIMDGAAAKAAAEQPDPEAERRAAQKRRQEDFAARQKEVERSIMRERRRIKMSRERLVIEWLAILLGALVVVFLLTQFVFVNARVPTESMEDTINVGDRVLGYRLAYLSDAPQRGEIVIFNYPDDERQLYVKRIAGLPGEELEIREGIVYINGVAEPSLNDHIKDAPQGNFGPYNIPADSYFMLGDNRNRSWDSRYWKNTYVTFEQIVGKAIYRFYPSVNKLE